MSTVIYYVQVNVTCAVILLMILCSIPRYNYRTKRARIYNLLLISAIMYCISDLVAGVLRGRMFPGARELIWASNIIYSVSMIITAFLWVIFSTLVLKGEVDNRIIMVSGGFCAAVVLANLITPVTKLIFYVDENNLYHRGNFIILNWVYVYVSQLFPFILMTSSDVNRREKRAIALYPVFPLIASVIQIMFYGVSAGQVGVTCSLVLVYIVLQGREINDHKRKQERLEIESELAKSANEAKGRFLATMSHEIRTPINAILGMDTMILRESKESLIREYAMDIHTASHSLLSLVNDILDFSKIESGKMEIIPVQYEFANLINDLYNMIRVRTEEKGLALNINVDKRIPKGLIGDDVRIRQILLNIMGNAAKYTDKGSVTLDVEGERLGDTVRLHFSVQDTGIGIKDADIERLFVDYERVENERNRKIEGTGLGISISSKLLEMMDSKLCVESVYGEGSVFFFDIIQKICDYEQVGDFTARILRKAESFVYNASFTAPDANILVVDDNKMNRDVFCALVKENGINIDQSGSGAEALSMIKNKKYDIVFLDHMMPEMDGLEVISAVRESIPKDSDTTVYVALTANALSGSREFYVGAGFDDYMSKPIIPEVLENLLERYIPEDKLIVATDIDNSSEDIRATKEEPVKEELPLVEGVDWNYASLHYRSQDALNEAIKTFYNMLPIEEAELEKYYDMLLGNPEDVEALNNYRIKVHAMKNEANLIGGYFLGGSAAMLEYASRDGRIKQVIETTPYFLNSWNSYRDKLKVLSFLSSDTDRTPVAGNEDTIKQLLNDLTEAMQSFDVHASDELVSKLEGYEYSEDVESDIAVLKGHVSNLDPDNVENTVHIILGKLFES